MSFPDAFAPDMVLGPDQVLPTVPRDFGERFTLNWKAARAPDKSYFYETRMSELWEDALEKLRVATGQTFVNPFTLAPAQSVSKLSPAGMVIDTLQRTLFGDRQKGIDAALKAFDQAREGQFDLPDPRRFEDRVRAEATKLRQDAEKSALVSYGAGGLGAFLGAAAGELSHPVNVATLPLGGEYAIANVARMGLLKFLGRNAMLEGGVAAVSQTAIEAMDAPIQERLATDTGIGDRIERILIAAAGGAALGLGLSGLVAAVRGVRGGRARMTLEEADALKVAERNATFSERNPLGPDGANAHTRALDAAEVAVSEGRHADVREIVRDEVRQQARALTKPADYPDELKAALARYASNDPRLPSDESIMLAAARANRLPEDRVVYRGYNEKHGMVMPGQRLIGTSDLEGGKAFSGERNFPAIEQAMEDGRTFAAPVAEIRLPAGTGVLEPSSFGRQSKREREVLVALEGRLVEDGPARIEKDGEFAYKIQPYRIEAEPANEAGRFDIFDSAAATRSIADAAPVPPEKPPAGMREAKADEARAMVIQKDFEVSMPDGTKRMASEIMAEADEGVKAAKLAAECAAGGAIG